MKIVAGIFLICALAAGCDPVRRINMTNETGNTVTFVWNLREDSLLFNPFFIYHTKELTFQLTPKSAKSVALSFGPGNWSPSEVQKLVHQLESLEIVSPAKHLKIDSLAELTDFLLVRRKGVGGARIEIVVKE